MRFQNNYDIFSKIFYVSDRADDAVWCCFQMSFKFKNRNKSEKYYHRNVDYTVRIEFLSCNYSVLASRESYTSITKRNTKGQSLQLFYCDKEKIRRWLWVIFFNNLWSTRSFLEKLYWTLLFVSISVLPFSNWNKCKYVKHHRNWTVKNFWFFSSRTK